MLDDYGAPDTIEADRGQLYRRMVFNILASNGDDHLRNHGFLAGLPGMKLSPAHDMHPAPDKLVHAIMVYGHSASPSLETARDVAGMFGSRIPTQMHATTAASYSGSPALRLHGGYIIDRLKNPLIER